MTLDRPPVWRRSTHCGPNGTCVEVARLSAARVGVRDAAQAAGSGPVLTVSATAWRALLTRVRAGSLP
ncbi:MAG TPA: DUF397 domain-containing protein [Thermomonospora sp.]|nr:DUF397 domain-containing protein [Thermomonospora sp.]